jgi:SNF2-related domain/RING-type zinc-finger
MIRSLTYEFDAFIPDREKFAKDVCASCFTSGIRLFSAIHSAGVELLHPQPERIELPHKWLYIVTVFFSDGQTPVTHGVELAFQGANVGDISKTLKKRLRLDDGQHLFLSTRNQEFLELSTTLFPYLYPQHTWLIAYCVPSHAQKLARCKVVQQTGASSSINSPHTVFEILVPIFGKGKFNVRDAIRALFPTLSLPEIDTITTIPLQQRMFIEGREIFFYKVFVDSHQLSHPETKFHESVDKASVLENVRQLATANVQEARRKLGAAKNFRRLLTSLLERGHGCFVSVKTPEDAKVAIVIHGCTTNEWLTYRLYSHPSDSEIKYSVGEILAEHGFFQTDKDVLEWVAATNFSDVNSAFQSPLLKTRLNDHQLSAIAFMKKAEERTGGAEASLGTFVASFSTGEVQLHSPITNSASVYSKVEFEMLPRGGFLSDSSLGKTFTVLGIVALSRNESRPTLVLCPSPLLGEWAEEEASRLAPSLRTVLYYGRKRRQITSQDMAASDLVVTTYKVYAMAHREFENVAWYRVIYDESHSIPRSFRRPDALCHWFITDPFRPFQNLETQLQMLGVRVPLYTHSREKLYHVSNALMTRRSHGDEIQGQRIRQELINVVLDVQEADRYKLLCDKAREALEKSPLRSVARSWKDRILRRLNGDSSDTEKIDSSLICPEEECSICYQTFDRPVKTVCNHWFCQNCLKHALTVVSSQCPLCRRPLNKRTQMHRGVCAHGHEPNAVVNESIQSKLRVVVESLVCLCQGDSPAKCVVISKTVQPLVSLSQLLKGTGYAALIHGGINAELCSKRIRDFRSTGSRTHILLLTERAASTGVALKAATNVFLLNGDISIVDAKLGAIATIHKVIIRNTLEEHLPIQSSNFVQGFVSCLKS